MNRMLNRWHNNLNSFNISDSSFGDIFNKRYNVMSYLFKYFERLSKTSHYINNSISSNKNCLNLKLKMKIRNNQNKLNYSNVKVPIEYWESIKFNIINNWYNKDNNTYDINNIKGFISNICQLEHLILYDERREVLDNFFNGCKNNVKIKGLLIMALMCFSIRQGSPIYLLDVIQYLNEYQNDVDQAGKFLSFF